MVDDFLASLTPTQFFGAIGIVLALKLITALLAVTILIVFNINILEWME